jgi:REP element-mobilizing transposase RayT
MLSTKEQRREVSDYLYDHADEKDIYMKKNCVNAEHVHALIDLPVDRAVKDVAQLLKGSSSHWINKNDVSGGKFAWSTGYAAFSVSNDRVPDVVQYIADQQQHHRATSFREEWETFLTEQGFGDVVALEEEESP